MKKELFVCWVALLVGAASVMAADECTTIQGGTLTDSKNNPITLGYDQFGYNYEAHMFNGPFCGYTRDLTTCTDNEPTLMMKWNDAWLSNQDCSGDGKLDRHYGYDTYIGSGAWLTNHERGTYEQDGETCKYEYFVKIVAAPADAELIDGVWYTEDGTEIGYQIWGEFAVIQEQANDPCGNMWGTGVADYKAAHPGLGNW